MITTVIPPTPRVLPIAGPSVPRSLLLNNNSNLKQQSESEEIKKQENLNSIKITSNKIQSNSEINLHPKQLLFRTRLADHLLAAPGVSFARSLSAYSSSHGTIRTSSSIPRRHPKRISSPSQNSDQSSSSSNSQSGSAPTPQHSSQPPQPTSPQHSSQSPQPTSCPASPLTQNNDLGSNVSPVLDTSTASASTTKPKCWAELLRCPVPPSKSQSSKTTLHHDRSLSSNASNSPHPLAMPINHSIHQDRELLLSQKLSILRDQDQPYYLIPRGLVNNGNICFANAILQVLLHCPPFFNLLKHLSRILIHELNSKTPLLDAMIAFIHEFQTLDTTELQPILDSNGKLIKYKLPTPATHLRQGDPFIAESVWMATKDNFRFDGMRRGQQEDAQEFLCFFLDSLHEELLCVTQKHDSLICSKRLNPNSISSEAPFRLEANEVLNPSEWLEVGARGQAAVTRSMDACPSPLTQLFDLKTRSVLHRSGQKDSVTFEPTNMLQLSIEHPSITTIEQALAHFSSPEVISDMLSKNGQRVSATKQVYIESFPPVLVLHLKRFHYNSQDGTVHKSNKAIRFGTELKIPSVMRSPSQRGSQNGGEGEVEFKLFAVVYHHGPHASGGHYTVSIRQSPIHNWVYIDDTHITPSNNLNLVFNGTNASNDESENLNDGHSISSSKSAPVNHPPSVQHKKKQSKYVGTNGPQNHRINGHSNHQNEINTPYLFFYTRC